MDPTKRSHKAWQRANARADAKVRLLEAAVAQEIARIDSLIEPAKCAEVVEKCGVVGTCHALSIAIETMMRKVRDAHSAIYAQECAAREHLSNLNLGGDFDAEISETQAVADASASKLEVIRDRCSRRIARTVAAEIEAR